MAIEWQTERQYDEILYETYNGIAKITINRPHVHNAFTPKTVSELIDAFSRARDNSNVGVIVLAGAGGKAFCSGGDQKVRCAWRLRRRRSNPTSKCIRLTAFDSCHSKTSYRNGGRLCDWRRTRSSHCV